MVGLVFEAIPMCNSFLCGIYNDIIMKHQMIENFQTRCILLDHDSNLFSFVSIFGHNTRACSVVHIVHEFIAHILHEFIALYSILGQKVGDGHSPSIAQIINTIPSFENSSSTHS